MFLSRVHVRISWGAPELNQVHRLGPGLDGMGKFRGWSLDVKLWNCGRGKHVYHELKGKVRYSHCHLED